MIPDRTRRTILISTIHATTPLIASLVPERLQASTVASEGVDKLKLDNKRITRPKETESLLFTAPVRYENVVKSKQNTLPIQPRTLPLILLGWGRSHCNQSDHFLHMTRVPGRFRTPAARPIRPPP